MCGEIEVGRRRSRLDLRRKKKGKVKCGVVDVVTHVHIKCCLKKIDTSVAHTARVRHREYKLLWRTMQSAPQMLLSLWRTGQSAPQKLVAVSEQRWACAQS